ncbi:Gfo/Idh/MocA family protein [Stieleria varia]|uniref:1,5-anhydro-D-fructose reductase n=1 Tax=Stieleria varia TaxID=2528005 RepID=A0A5C6B229_9BACT|nr:Gfo/Idh/MocA family oxidoreductase [Stieleria varia]TWU05529.1 1,5-anhydro-D-fructose reductase [Stieleria varia]
MSNKQCRWGFFGTAAIARKNWKAIRLSGNGRVAAVASRTADRAQTFIDECNDEYPAGCDVSAVGSYEGLLERDDVDAVYIPLPTGLRKEWAIAAAAAGKHVLIEKPVANNSSDAAEIIAACEDAGVQFMDGVMFDHSERLAKVKQQIGDGTTVGKLRRINAHFSFAGDAEFQKSNIRVDSVLETHGCLGDLGWYCIRFILQANGLVMPTSVSARTLTPLQGENSPHCVPGEMSGELIFPDGVSAGFYCSFLTENHQRVSVSGDKGYIAIEDFVLPFYDSMAHWTTSSNTLEIDNCRWNFRRETVAHSIPEYASGEANSQEVKMLRTFNDLVLSGKRDPLYPELAIKTQRILDACRKSDVSDGRPVQP